MWQGGLGGAHKWCTFLISAISSTESHAVLPVLFSRHDGYISTTEASLASCHRAFFRYCAHLDFLEFQDAMRAVTKVAVRESRIKEIRQEMLNSQKLKTYFVDNPRDLQVLRHDKTLHTVRVQPHLKHVPDYLIPPVLRPVVKSRPVAPGPQKSRKTQPTKGEMRIRVSAVSYCLGQLFINTCSFHRNGKRTHYKASNLLDWPRCRKENDRRNRFFWIIFAVSTSCLVLIFGPCETDFSTSCVCQTILIKRLVN